MIPLKAPSLSPLAQINRLVAQRHPSPEWIFLTEVRTKTGYSSTIKTDLDSERYIDAFALNTFPSNHFHRVAYEYKTSRSDWLAELANPMKKVQAFFLSHEFWFVLADGVFLDADFKTKQVDPLNGIYRYCKTPYIDGCGILIVTPGDTLHMIQRAVKRQTFPMPDTFIASLLRRAMNGNKNGS